MPAKRDRAAIRFTRDDGLEAFITFDVAVMETHMGVATVTEHAVEKGANIADHVRPENDRVSLELVVSNTPVTDQTIVGGTPRQHSHMDGIVAFRGAAQIVLERPWRRRESGGPRLLSSGVPPSNLRSASASVSLAAGFGPEQLTGSLGAGVALAGVVNTPGSPPTFEARAESDVNVPLSQPDVLQFSGEFDRVRRVFDELDGVRQNGRICTIYTSLRAYENMVLESVTVPRTAEDGGSIRINIEARRVRLVTTQTVQVRDAEQPRDRQKKARGNQPTQKPDTAQAEKASVLYKLIN